jgi:23S rRNA pseudouridine2604 synthase
MRINKYIGSTGLCSRREADVLVEKKRVTINGEIAEAGSTVGEDDVVEVDGKVVKPLPKSKAAYIAFNKPVGIITTTDIREVGNIVDFVAHHARVFPIGRLDKDSEGLILLTTDGDIVNKILRAENEHEKEYLVTINKSITPQFLKSMANGVEILGTKTKKCKVDRINDRIFRIILTQGLNRQIRRMCEALGFRVLHLQRIRVMNIRLEGLKVGHWRNLTHKELSELMETLEN